MKRERMTHVFMAETNKWWALFTVIKNWWEIADLGLRSGGKRQIQLGLTEFETLRSISR